MIRCITFLLCTVACSQLFAATRLEIPDEISAEINSRIDQGLYVGVIVGVLDADGERYFSFGRKSLTQPEAPDKDTVFTVGSISKTFAAAVLADMVRSKEIGYDEPIRSFLPDSVRVPIRNGTPITIWNLATHTSGLPLNPTDVSDEDLWDGYRHYHREQAYSALENSPLLFDAGKDISYSSFGFALLVDILVQASGTTWEQLLSERILEPLALNNTSTLLSPESKENFAQGYCYLVPTSADVRMVISENGSVKSTAKDMLKYLGANMGMLNSNIGPALQSTHEVQFDRGPVPETNQGLGWWIRNDYILHTGMTDGYRSFVAFNKKRREAVVVLSNSSTYMQDIAMKLIEPDFELWKPKSALSIALMNEIERIGVDQATDHFLSMSEQERSEYWVNLEGLIDGGIYHVRDGDINKGIGILRVAEGFYPENTSVQYALGYSYTRAGDEDRAAYHFARFKKYDQK